MSNSFKKRLIAGLLLLCMLVFAGCMPGGTPQVKPTDPSTGGTLVNPTDPSVPTSSSDPTTSTDPDAPTQPGSDPQPTDGTEPTVNTEPTTPAPTDPQPTESTPTGPQPTDPQPTQPQPTESQPADPEPTQEPTAPSTPTQPDDPPPSDHSDAQGLKHLQSLANGSTLVQAYNTISQALAKADASIDGCGLTEDQLKLVFTCIRNDFPQYFWVAGAYEYTISGGKILSIKPSYSLSGTALTTAKSNFDSKVNKILSKINSSMSDYEKELIIHDELLNNCYYDLTAPNAHSAYGAIVEGRAVCEGYARAFQYLLNKVGISCMIVTGHSKGEAHAWTAVNIGGDWYYTDPTWDDPVGADRIYYAYFNLTRKQMEEDHTFNASEIPLPTATATRYNYHVYNGTAAASFDAAQLGKWLKPSLTARFYVTGDVEKYIQNMRDNFSSVMGHAGITGGCSYSYAVCGREIILTVTPK